MVIPTESPPEVDIRVLREASGTSHLEGRRGEERRGEEGGETRACLLYFS